MAVGGVTLTGGAELVVSLAAVADGLGHLDDAARAASEALVADARGRAPKATGALARSLRATVSNGAASVGTPVSYGLPVHFGVPSRNQRPQPFLAAAIRSQDAAMLTAYTRDVQALIDRSV